jgi:hypothetical protein
MFQQPSVPVSGLNIAGLIQTAMLTKTGTNVDTQLIANHFRKAMDFQGDGRQNRNANFQSNSLFFALRETSTFTKLLVIESFVTRFNIILKSNICSRPKLTMEREMSCLELLTLQTY